MINLLAPASAPDLVTCVCESKDYNCQDWGWSLLGDAMDMPADLSHYGIPLVTHILEYSVSADRLSRYTADSALCNAIFLNDLEILDFLLEAADETTLKAWLRRKNSEGVLPLFGAMTDTIANPTWSLDVVRSLLDKGASLGSSRLAPLGFSRIVQKQTARQFALISGRADLVALVKEHDKKQKVRSV